MSFRTLSFRVLDDGFARVFVCWCVCVCPRHDTCSTSVPRASPYMFFFVVVLAQGLGTRLALCRRRAPRQTRVSDPFYCVSLKALLSARLLAPAVFHSSCSFFLSLLSSPHVASRPLRETCLHAAACTAVMLRLPQAAHHTSPPPLGSARHALPEPSLCSQAMRAVDCSYLASFRVLLLAVFFLLVSVCLSPSLLVSILVIFSTSELTVRHGGHRRTRTCAHSPCRATRIHCLLPFFSLKWVRCPMCPPSAGAGR